MPDTTAGAATPAPASSAPDMTSPAIRVTMMPRDTNAHGTIFGGTLLAYVDLAGGIATRPYCDLVVTVKMTEVVFHEPVFVGDVVSFYASVRRIGRTSITVGVVVEAERWRTPGSKVKVTEAEIVYVNVDERRRPVPIERGREGG
jgi:acyl-CoA thioesterase YciA